jgi:hypothetical protein
MKIDGNYVTFSSGKVLSANQGIIGIDPDLDVSEGYDGGFDIADTYRETLTKPERRELADYMIALWQRYREVRG